MNRDKVIPVLRSLRCVDCQRGPTHPEVEEMYANFGHKLKSDDGPFLRWQCMACKTKERS